MRITEKAGEFINKVFELSSETCTYQMLRKKGKEIFKHNMSEDWNLQNLNFVKFNSWALTFYYFVLMSQS